MSKGLLIFTTLFLLSNSKFLNQFSPEMNAFLLQNNFMAESNDSKTEDKNPIINVKCFWVNKTNVYQLFALQKKNADYIYESKDKKSKIIYNFCQDIVNTLDGEKINSNIVYLDDNLKYKRLTGSLSTKGQSPKNTWSVYNKKVENKNVSVLKISFEEGDEYKNGEKYKTIIHLECNKTVNNIELNLQNVSINKRENIIYGRSKHACPINHYYILEFLMNLSPVVTCILACVFGAFLVFLGAKAVKGTVIIVTTLVVVIAGLLLIFTLFTIETERSIFIILGILTIIGFIVGCILIKVVKLFIMILGASLGFSISTFVYDAILPLIKWDAQLLYYVTVVACCILFALIALCVVKHVLIFGTSIIGGYLIIRGSSLIIGKYPNESQLLDLVKHEEWEQIDAISNDSYVYFYLFAWFLISLIGIIIQYKSNKDDKDENEKLIK